MKVLLLLHFMWLIVFNSFSQNSIKVSLNQTVVLNYDDHIVYAHILTTENKVKPKDELYYHWFNANDIKCTRGDFDGKLLHGVYTDFYLNKNLKEKGEFKYGLKDGEWKSWYMNGEYKSIYNYKKGLKEGKYRIYDEAGAIVEEGEYDDGILKKVKQKKSSMGKGLLRKKKAKENNDSVVSQQEVKEENTDQPTGKKSKKKKK